MNTMVIEEIETGDVIEVANDGEWTTALVLLATPEALILDLCDGSTPIVARREELGEYRVFVGN
jgi:hypothetical protein